jgi:nucleotide-binding universal stress UspA family protein
MGAFGHSRFREFLFGGVTQTFLSLADGPALLLAH